MAETILPGVYIDVRSEGLIVAGQISVGTVGMVGTASKGPIANLPGYPGPALLSSYDDAVRVFGESDAWGTPNELTLVRALQLAFAHGASSVYAARVAKAAVKATFDVASAGGTAAKLEAKSEGAWANDIAVNVVVSPPGEHAVIVKKFLGSAAPITLAPVPLVESARNRVQFTDDPSGITRQLQVIYTGAPGVNQVKMDTVTGALTFGDPVTGSDQIVVTYTVHDSKAAKVTLRLGTQTETYTVVDGNDLVADINDETTGSAWVTATPGNKPAEVPKPTTPTDGWAPFTKGENGAADVDYQKGLDALLTVDAHIIVAAGQDDAYGNKVAGHCDLASTDTHKRDRIGVTGSGRHNADKLFDKTVGHALDSERLIFVAPGIRATDAASSKTVTLPGAYTAAAVAGKLSALDPHVSLTNKPLPVDGLERVFNPAELAQLVKSRVLALEQRQGFRVVKGITTSTSSAFAQITTRRIVDYAKYGVRSAANPYIGRLNNERVRGAMRTTINAFLDDMVQQEMLTGYDLAVSATRDDERRGIARVTMTLRPTFSIDYIRVVINLE